MPLLKLQSSVDLSEAKRSELLPALSRIVTEGLGKPEQYVMVTIESASIMLAGERGGAAFVEVRSIGGLSRDVNNHLSSKICDLLKESLGITPDRVYLNFSDIRATDWGWSGRTFG